MRFPRKSSITARGPLSIPASIKVVTFPSAVETHLIELFLLSAMRRFPLEFSEIPCGSWNGDKINFPSLPIIFGPPAMVVTSIRSFFFLQILNLKTFKSNSHGESHHHSFGYTNSE